MVIIGNAQTKKKNPLTIEGIFIVVYLSIISVNRPVPSFLFEEAFFTRFILCVIPL